jgi:hypothetical protein
MSDQFGPWATSINVGANPQLSSFWRRRLRMLVPASQTSLVLSPRSLGCLLATGALLIGVPTLHLGVAAAEEEKPSTAGQLPARNDVSEKPAPSTEQGSSKQVGNRNRSGDKEKGSAEAGAAQRAYEATVAAYRTGNADIEAVYRWSCRWMQADRDKQGNAAIKSHLARIQAFHSQIAELHKIGSRGGEEANLAAASYYVVEAKEMLDRTNTSGADIDDTKRVLDEFYRFYSLKEGEVWKRIAPPFSSARSVYCWTSESRHGERLMWGLPSHQRTPTSMRFTWRDGALHLAGWSVGGSEVFYSLTTLAGIHRQEIEGDVELMRSEGVQCDWICREGVPKQKMIAELEKVLNRDCKLNVKLSLRDEERQVFVARGEFKLHPLPGVKNRKGIYLYDKESPESYDGGNFTHGSLDQFVRAIGPYVRIRTACEVQKPPKDDLAWYGCPSPEHSRLEDVKDRDAASVLKHVTEQTGITFTEETRTVPVLHVERVK